MLSAYGNKYLDIAEHNVYYVRMEEHLEEQAKIISRYLVGHTPSRAIRQRYVQAIQASPLQISKADHQLLQYITRHPWAIGIIDAFLVFSNPESEVRRRLYVLFAILEASPEDNNKFLPTKRNASYIFYVGYVGARSFIKALIGGVWVRIITR